MAKIVAGNGPYNDYDRPHGHNGRKPASPAFEPPAPSLEILMTSDTVGGVWIYSLELIRALSQKGHQVTLATMGAPLSAKQRREINAISGAQLRHSRYKLEWMDNPWADIEAAGRWLLDIEQEVQPDLIHLNGYAHGAWPWQAPKLIVGHSCVLSWWQAVKNQSPPKTWDLYRRCVRRGLQAADLVLAPTQAMLTALDYHYGPLEPSQVAANGRDPDLFIVGRKEPFIFTASRLWDEAKNIKALDRVAPRLPWPIYAAGEDRHPSGGRVQLRRLKSLGRLSFEELLPWFAQASIYALPARYEPFGLSALEAAMAGCALVLGDIPSLREVWGRAALFVPPDDDQALARTLRLLIHNPGFRIFMARCARKRAERFTSHRMAERYLAIYETLVSSREVIS